MANWIIETVDSLGSFGHLYSVIALDSGDNPHIAFQVSSWPTDDLVYAYKSGGSWSTETVDSGNVGEECAIAIDSNDYPHISYYDSANDALKYAYKDAGGWNVETVDNGNGDDVGEYSGIAIDSNDYPHIVYLNDAEPNSLEYAYKDIGGWHYEVVDDTNSVGSECSVVLDGSDYPHVSYLGKTNGTSDTKYAYKDVGGWNIEVAASDGNGDAITSSTVIDLDSSGYPHIAHTEVYASPLRRYVHYSYKDGMGWHTEVVDNVETDYQCFGFALDSNDLAHISYYDMVNDDAKYAVRDVGGSWAKEIIESAGNVGHSTSLALDSRDNPHVAYADWTNYEQKYAYVAAVARTYFFLA